MQNPERTSTAEAKPFSWYIKPERGTVDSNEEGWLRAIIAHLDEPIPEDVTRRLSPPPPTYNLEWLAQAVKRMLCTYRTAQEMQAEYELVQYKSIVSNIQKYRRLRSEQGENWETYITSQLEAAKAKDVHDREYYSPHQVAKREEQRLRRLQIEALEQRTAPNQKRRL